MRDESKVQLEDVIPVRSRISWGAILGGSILALALYFLFTVLGAAAGLSLNGNVSAQSMRIGATIYAVFVTAICLFVGGFYASRLTVGENGIEAAIYGVLVWAVVFGTLFCLMASGVRTGFHAMVGVATAARGVAVDAHAPTWDELARRAGVPADQITIWKQKAEDAPAAKQGFEDPHNQQAAINATSRITWYTFFGGWLSMMTAALGGFCGAGPMVRVVGLMSKRTEVVRAIGVNRTE